MKTLTTFILAGALALLAQPNQLDLRQDPPVAVQSERVSSAYTGTSGATTYYYWVVTRYPIGFIVPTSPVVVGGASALGGGNSVALGWPAMTGASSYDVLRTTTNAAPSSCTCAVVLATTGTTLTDNGGALSAWPPGGLNSAGVAQAEFQINNRDAGAPYITLAVRNAQQILNYQLGILKNGTAPSYVPSGFIQPYANPYGRLACVDSAGVDCLNSEVYVVNFGAQCDGTTDDYASIAAAVVVASAPSAKARTIVFPAGTCLISSTINLSANSVSVVGQGYTHDQTSLLGTVIKKTFNGNGIYITGGSVELRNLVLNGNSTTGNMVQVSGPNSTISNVSFVNAEIGLRIGNDAAAGFNANQWRLYNVTARNNSSHGIFISDNTGGGSSANASAGIATGVFAYGNGGSGLVVGEAFANNFHGVNGESNTGYGVLVTGANAQNNVFWNPHAEDNTAGQVYLDAASLNNLVNTADNNLVIDDGSNSTILSGGGVSQLMGFSRSLIVSSALSTTGIPTNRGALTWTIGLEGDTPGRYFWNTAAVADSRLWREVVSGTSLIFKIASDDIGTETNWMRAARVGATAVTTYFEGGNVHVSNGAVVPIRIDWQTSALGACDSGSVGRQRYVAGGAGVADRFVVCGKSAADAYDWYDIATIP